MDDVQHGDAERLIRSVPDSSRTVLQVGAGTGWLAAGLKERVAGRMVYGLVDPDGAQGSTPRGLDGLFELEIAQELPALELGSIDTIVYADVLSRFTDPLAILELHRPLLSETGTISCSVPNLQHHTIVTQLLRGVFRYADDSPVDSGQVHLFTFSGVVQLLLDGGFAPHVIDTTEPMSGTDEAGADATGPEAADRAATSDILSAGAPLFEFLGVGVRDLDRHLRTSHMVAVGERQTDIAATEEVPLTFVVCVNDDAQLEANLLSSPCLGPGSPHELLQFRNCASAAEGLNAGLAQAKNEFVVLVHQDVYLPKGWPARMMHQWRHAQKTRKRHRGSGGLRHRGPPRPLRLCRQSRASRALAVLGNVAGGRRRPRRSAHDAAPRHHAALRPGPQVGPVRDRCGAPGPRARVAGRGARCALPPQHVDQPRPDALSRERTRLERASGSTSSPFTPTCPRLGRGCSRSPPTKMPMQTTRTQRARWATVKELPSSRTSSSPCKPNGRH